MERRPGRCHGRREEEGAAAFGFRPLPEGLARGTGLVEHGLAPSADVGERLLERNPRLQHGAVWGLALGPLESLVAVPDVIIIQDEAEKEMWGWWSAWRSSRCGPCPRPDTRGRTGSCSPTGGSRGRRRSPPCAGKA